MNVSDSLKNLYWNHFIEEWALGNKGGFPHGITGPKLRKVKVVIWDDNDFWWDIILRHGGNLTTPEQMTRDTPETYNHCKSNFWNMIYQDIK